MLVGCVHAPTWVNREGALLEDPDRMLAWVGIAVAVLASPAQRGGTQPLSSDVLSPSLVRHAPESSTSALLEAWLAQLAVVRTGQRGARTSSMTVFLAVAPVGRHGTGLQVIGSF